jgi:hypothetical protein
MLTNEIDFAPSPDEVARKAYFSYVNQGSPQGHEVQHWLEAEAQLLAERKLTRVHGFTTRRKINFPTNHPKSNPIYENSMNGTARKRPKCMKPKTTSPRSAGRN